MTSKSKNLIKHFNKLRANFLEKVATTNEIEDIQPWQVFNLDQTGLTVIPSGPWTMEQRGAKYVEFNGLSNKHQVTAVLCGTFIRNILLVQLVYQDKVEVPSSVLIRCRLAQTHSPNHWSTKKE